MSSAPSTNTVQSSVVVDAPIEEAFRVFTEDFGRFRPAEHNLLGVEIAETVFEPRVIFSWDISPSWQIETDLNKTSEVEVRFIAERSERTRVELEHRYLERHGDGWAGVQAGVRGDDGWPLYLRRYAELLG